VSVDDKRQLSFWTRSWTQSARDEAERAGTAAERSLGFRAQFRILRDRIAPRKTGVPAFLNRALMQVTSLPSRFGGLP
jgi:hypothetical protein